MKPINPASGKKPNGWQFVYDKYRSLRNIAHKAGVDVSGWQLYHVDSLKERIQKGANGWEMTYSIGEVHQRVFLGHNSATATQALKSMIEKYPRHKRVEKAVVSKPKPRNPATDPNIIMKLFEEWQSAVRKAGREIPFGEWEKIYGPRFRLLHQKAGILPMSILEYLTRSHPHSKYWPAPPISEEQYRNRQIEFEKILREQERQRERDRERQGY